MTPHYPFIHQIRAPLARYGPSQILDGAECAWKLWLDLRAGMRILDLSCGYGGRSISMARHGVHLISIDTDPVKTRITRHRLSAEFPAQHRDHTVLTVTRLDRLPLPDSFVDLVLLPEGLPERLTGTPHPDNQLLTLDLCSEVRRVLKDTGQVVIAGSNKWDPERVFAKVQSWIKRAPFFRTTPAPFPITTLKTNASLMHYQRLLRASGANLKHCLSLSRDCFGNLQDIRDLDRHAQSNNRKSLKQKIQQSRWLAQEYTLIGERPGDVHTPLIEKILSKISEVIPQFSRETSPIIIGQTHLSRKDKLILSTNINNQPLILRIALAPRADTSEKNAAKIMKYLASNKPNSSWFPRVLYDGEFEGISFVAEERITGTSLRANACLRGSRSFQLASDMLHRMNPHFIDSSYVNLQGSLFNRFVTRPLDHVLSFVDATSLHKHLRHYLYENLYGRGFATGLTHGDFSISNFLLAPDASPYLIDWEDGDVYGLPVLDALTFAYSRYRHRIQSRDPESGTRTPLFPSIPWDACERAFLGTQYERCLKEPVNEYALTCLYWITIASNLLPFTFMQRQENINFYIQEPLQYFLSRIE